jgi:2-polyprenyl-3-methyl-5-hydroxy-6-metoxy-1,4-benzoquinol methylase
MKRKTENKFFKCCPVCNSNNIRKIFNKKWNSSSFVKCQKCRLIFQNPQEHLSQTISRYDGGYFKYEMKNELNFFNLIKKTLDDFNIVNILPEKAIILEVGSATGLFLKYMGSFGFKATGVEVCSESVEYGRKKYGVNLLNCRLEDAGFKAESFDFIHASHLIEHLNDPVSFMQNVNNLLKPGGLSLITTPNSCGLFSRVFGESWRCIVDDHLFIFNKNNLEMIFNKTGFEVLSHKTWGSIPLGKSIKRIKRFFDFFVKKFSLGDVIAIMIKKT